MTPEQILRRVVHQFAEYKGLRVEEDVPNAVFRIAGYPNNPTININKVGKDYVDIEFTMWLGEPTGRLDLGELLIYNGKYESFFGVKFVAERPFVINRDIYRYFLPWGIDEIVDIFSSRYSVPPSFKIDGIRK